MKEYRIFIEDKLVGITNLENGDPPMGVVFGTIKPCVEFNYRFIKNLCELKDIDIADEISEDKFISTMSTLLLKILNNDNVEIKGKGNQISGMDKYGYEISIFGIHASLYKSEFPQHVKEFENRLK